jgi:hypothetical protein
MNTKARASDGLNILKLERVDAMELPIHKIREMMKSPEWKKLLASKN